MKKLFLNILYGIAWGCTFFVIMGMIFTTTGVSDTAYSGSEFIKQAIGSMIVGIGWFAPSTIYSSDKITMALKVMIHMVIGMVTLISVGFTLKWIPVQFGIGTILTTIIIMILISFIIYACFYFYYRNEAKKINKKIQSIKSK